MKVVMRKWMPADQRQVLSLLKEAAFSNIWPAFRVSINKKTFQHTTIAVATIAYLVTWSKWIFFTACIPCFVLAWLLQLTAAVYYVYGPPLADMKTVEAEYFTDSDTHFWVAVLVDGEKKKKKIIGTIAVVKKPDTDGLKIAWLRRMAVLKQYRGSGVAKLLVQNTIQFCQTKGYDRIDLITTEIQSPARRLYAGAGFKIVGFKPYKYFHGLIRIWTYELQYDLTAHRQQSSD